jgi:hypothetical protein
VAIFNGYAVFNIVIAEFMCIGNSNGKKMDEKVIPNGCLKFVATYVSSEMSA